MKLFTRHLTSDEFINACIPSEFSFDAAQHLDGDDHISFSFFFEDVEGSAVYSTVTGRVFGTAVGPGWEETRFSTDDLRDGEPWFDALLNFVYR